MVFHCGSSRLLEKFGLSWKSVIILQVILSTDISKRLKSAFFSQYVLKQTAQLLLSESAESGRGDEDSSRCQVAFQFLLRLCTDFQCGICYRSRPPPEGLERYIRNYPSSSASSWFHPSVSCRQHCATIEVQCSLFRAGCLMRDWQGFIYNKIWGGSEWAYLACQVSWDVFLGGFI